MNPRTIARFTLALVIAAMLGSLAGARAERVVQRESQIIPQPETLIGFSADVTRYRGTDVLSGRYYRRSDGSFRTDYTSGTPSVTVTSIHNVSQEKFYINSPRAGWVVHDEPAETGIRPRRWVTTAPGLLKYRYKLAVLRGQDQNIASNEGLDAWVVVNEAGAVQIMAPALNFFHVIRAAPNGDRDVFTNIVIEEPDPAFFQPPPSANPRVLPRPQAPAAEAVK